MKTSPVELRQLELKKVMLGIEPNQVKLYFENAADDIEALVIENKNLKEELQKYKKIESEFKEAFEKAQESAKSIVEKAKQEADSLIQDTQRKSEEMESQLNKLRNEREDFLLQFKKLLTSYLSMLESEFATIQNEDKSKSCPGSQGTGSDSNV